MSERRRVSKTQEHRPLEDEVNRITIYTDGAASGNPGPGGWACKVDGELFSGGQRWATNNEMEVYAVVRALEECSSFTHATVITDSKLVIGWLKAGWRCRNPNISQMIRAYHAIREAKEILVDFVHIHGHTGERGNTRVDRAAYQNSQRIKRQVRAAA
jgi:ribonuclease HI